MARAPRDSADDSEVSSLSDRRRRSSRGERVTRSADVPMTVAVDGWGVSRSPQLPGADRVDE